MLRFFSFLALLCMSFGLAVERRFELASPLVFFAPGDSGLYDMTGSQTWQSRARSAGRRLGTVFEQAVIAASRSFEPSVAGNEYDIVSFLQKILNDTNDAERSAQNLDATYSRAKFGSGWTDDDRDCQNARHETLIADSLQQVTFKTEEKCQVKNGSWESLYTDKTILESSKLDIDHLVPLKWAWDHGAAGWSRARRIAFANDPMNLLPVEARLNRQKGAKGPDDWLPPKNQCLYFKMFERIKDAYALTYSVTEHSEMARIKVSVCGST